MTVNIHGDQILMDFVLSMIICEVLYVWHLKYVYYVCICSNWYFDIRISACFSYFSQLRSKIHIQYLNKLLLILIIDASVVLT